MCLEKELFCCCTYYEGTRYARSVKSQNKVISIQYTYDKPKLPQEGVASFPFPV